MAYISSFTPLGSDDVLDIKAKAIKDDVLSWDNTNKKIKTNTDHNIVQFTAGDGISLTAAADSLTIGSQAVIIKSWSEVAN